MKYRRNKILHFIILTFFVTLVSKISWAKDATPSSFLVEVGQRELKKGNVADAIHEFNKALLVNPNCVEAQTALENLGVAPKVYSQGYPTVTGQFVEPKSHVKNYQSKIAQLENEKREMENRLKELQAEHKDLYATYLQRDLEMDLLLNKISALKQLSEQDRQRYIDQVNDVAELYNDRSFKPQPALAQSAEMVSRPTATQDSDVQMKNLETELLKVGDQYRRLKAEATKKIELQNKLISLFGQYLEIRNARINASENKFVLNHIDQVRYQQELLKKTDEVASLYNQVGHYQGRINDRDKIMVEKSKNLELLQKELYETRQNDSHNQELIDEQNKKIMNLEKELQEAKKEIERLAG